MPAPYSDNLYSSYDSDPEDAANHDDALSPTDGYFHAQDSSPSSHETPYVPNVFVEDPSQRQRAKEEEARYNSASPWGTRRGVEDDGVDERAAGSSRPALQHIPAEAPPAYSPRSPASPTSPQSGLNYATFPSSSPTQGYSMGVPDEENRLLSRQPESMGDEPAPERRGLSRWEAYREEWKDAKWGTMRRRIRTVLSGLLILAILASLLGGLFSLHSDDSKDKIKNPEHKTPQPKPSPSHGSLKWTPLPQCHHNASPAHHYKAIANLAFNPSSNISIFQKIDDSDSHSGRTPHVSGNVVLQSAEDQDAGRMELEILSNHEDLSVRVDVNQLEQRMVLRTPRTVSWSEEGDPCIQLRITVYVPKGSTLERLILEVVHLDIDILSDLDVTLEQRALLAALSGDITAPSEDYTLSSREIWVETVSGDIKGTYPLYDLLALHTASGTITTGVIPKTVSSSDPKPATLNVASVSGDLQVREVLDSQTPARDYQVKFDTSSGSIDAEVAVSSEARFNSHSADFKVKIQPILEKGQAMDLTTDTKSGTTNLEILEPEWIKTKHHKDTFPNTPPDNNDNNDDPYLIIHPHSKTPLSTLTSKHSSISGDMKLRYPASWTGTFQAETLSGSQNFRGEGLRTETKVGMFPRVLRGRKGEGEGRLTVDSVSGTQDFLVGKEV